MELRGHSQSGYAMVALLVAMSIMAIMLTVAMPVWHQMVQREKETELIFRGQQYARAIGLFERKYANTPPPDFDVLVREHFLRKKYKDPMTGKDFVPIPATAAQAATPGGAPGRGAAPAQGQQPGTNAGQPVGAQFNQLAQAGGASGGAAGAVPGGIAGVTSASTEKSIRVYNGGTHYNEWRFVYAPPAAAPGGAAVPGATVPGQRGQTAQPGRGQPGATLGQRGRGGNQGAPPPPGQAPDRSFRQPGPGQFGGQPPLGAPRGR